MRTETARSANVRIMTVTPEKVMNKDYCIKNGDAGVLITIDWFESENEVSFSWQTICKDCHNRSPSICGLPEPA